MENQDKETTNLGSFFVDVNTRKGMFTPVRRSHRNKLKGEVARSDHDDSDKENENPSNVRRRRDESNISIDDLCSMFQTTVTVNNETLESEQDTVRLSPFPDEGRHTSLTETRDGKVNAVKRSTRSTRRKNIK